MGRKEKRWKRRLSGAEEEFVNKNLYRIDTFLESYTAKCIANKYFTDIKTHQGELTSDIYFALRRVAIGCDDYDNAFDWYGPAVFHQTIEEYFQTNIKKKDKLRDPWERKLKKRGKYILQKQRLRYISEKTENRSFKILDCQKISQLIRRAGLSKMQIRVFLLKARRDMSLTEISQKINRNLSTVKRHYYRAINKLKKYTKQTHLEIADVYRNLTEEEILGLN